jgi:hypothetical protein
MTVKANGQVDQELHLEHRCASAISRREPRHGDDRRDNSIADKVERRVVRVEALPKLVNNSRG